AEARQWASELAKQLLASDRANAVLAGAELAGSQGLKELQEPLAALANRKQLPNNARRAALDALVAINSQAQIPLLGRLLGESAEVMPLREHIAQLLAGINQPEAHAELLKTLSVAPARLQSVIAAALAYGPQGAAKLLEAVAAG